jgi:hypothetical protein
MFFQRDQQIIQDRVQGFRGIAFSLKLRCERDTNFGLLRVAFEHAETAVADQFAACEKKDSNLIPRARRSGLNGGQASNVGLNDVDGFSAPGLEAGNLRMFMVGENSWAIVGFEIANSQALR